MTRSTKALLSLFFLGTVAAFAGEEKEVHVDFPENFNWCVATAAHQIEGGSQDDWTDWENSGHTLDKLPAGPAADSWNRFDEDIQSIVNLAPKDPALRAKRKMSYRMSIDWARIFPTENAPPDAQAIARYKHAIDLMQKNGIEPQITLQHFTLPRWAAAKGGFEWDGLPDAMAKFTKVVYEQIAPNVRDWYTINEPMVELFGGYVTGQFPPGKTGDLSNLEKPMQIMLKTHAAAYKTLHESAKALEAIDGKPHPVRAGVAGHFRVFKAANALNPVDQILKGQVEKVWNWSFLDAIQEGRLKAHVPGQMKLNVDMPEIKGTQDFVGMNYYTGDRVSLSFFGKKSDGGRGPMIVFNPLNHGPKSDQGWDFDAKGIGKISEDIYKRYHLPIITSENGIADSRDFQREAFLRDHLYYISKAIKKGIPIEGYCYWSLLDNYEWLEGFHRKFGLYKVDYPSFKRTLRKSGEFYKSAIEHSGFVTDPKAIGRMPRAPEPARPGGNPLDYLPSRARFYTGSDGCSVAFDTVTDDKGDSHIKIYLMNKNFVSNPNDGILSIRVKDRVLSGGPRDCQNYMPFTKVRIDDASLPNATPRTSFRIDCGSALDPIQTELTLLSTKGELGQQDSILNVDYIETGLDNDPSMNLAHTIRKRKERNILNEFHCADLKPGRPARPAAPVEPDDHD